VAARADSSGEGHHVPLSLAIAWAVAMALGSISTNTALATCRPDSPRVTVAGLSTTTTTRREPRTCAKKGATLPPWALEHFSAEAREPFRAKLNRPHWRKCPAARVRLRCYLIATLAQL